MHSHHCKRWLSLLLCLLLTLSCSLASLAEGVSSPTVPDIHPEVPGDDPQDPSEGTCTHDSTTVNTVSAKSEYTAIEGDNSYHTYTEYFQDSTCCLICGEVIAVSEPYPVNSYKRVHTFKDNVCNDCGYVSTCLHTQVGMWSNWEGQPTYEEIKGDNRYHTISGTVVDMYFCNDCNTYINITDPYETSRNEPHNYQDGVCTSCGHTNDCKHENVHQWTNWDWDSMEITEIEGDNGYHMVSGKQYLITYCNSCESTVSESDRYDATEKETHNYDDGVCWRCGHVNDCKHENVEESNYWNWNSVVYTEIPDNNARHTMSGQKYLRTTCSDCKITVKQGKPFDATDLGYHYYVDGVCDECGHVNTCKHEDSDLRYYTSWQWDTLKTEEIEGNNARHYASGYKYDYVYCEGCSQTISEDEPYEAAGIESHNYDNTGVCYYCGHVNTCKHENTNQWTNWVWDSRVVEELEGDDVYHKTTGQVYAYTYCYDCETGVGRGTPYDTVEQEMHTYSNGVCEYCGHKNTCPHKYTITSNWMNSSSCKYEEIPGNDGDHLQTGTQTIEERCEYCKETLKTTVVKDASREVSHAYYDGVCAECGHKNACKHENVTEQIYRTNSKCSDPIAEGHYTTYDLVKYTFCSDCYFSLGEEVTVETGLTAFDAHVSYGGGPKCTQCGYVFGCEHENTKEETVWTANGFLVITPYDNTKHHCKGYNRTSVICEDCGAVLHNLEYSDGIVEGYEDHTMIDGQCALCGYKPAANTPVVPPVEESAEEPIELPAIEPLPVVETILSVAEEAQEEGAVVTIEVVGIDEVITTEEMEVMNTLPANEQLMVALAAIGFEEEVKSVAESLGITLSAEAENLMGTITTRQSEMTAEEKAELAEKLTKLFPVVEVVVDGVVYQYSVIELKIVVDGEERIEKFGFRLDENNEWELIRL